MTSRKTYAEMYQLRNQMLPGLMQLLTDVKNVYPETKIEADFWITPLDAEERLWEDFVESKFEPHFGELKLDLYFPGSKTGRQKVIYDGKDDTSNEEIWQRVRNFIHPQPASPADGNAASNHPGRFPVPPSGNS